MIRGIGVDIVEVARIRQSVEESGEQFLNRVFTQPEIDYCASKANRYQHLAARFAAKEAVSKALATGWAGDFRWKDVEVMNDPSGQPQITLHGMLLQCDLDGKPELTLIVGLDQVAGGLGRSGALDQ